MCRGMTIVCRGMTIVCSSMTIVCSSMTIMYNSVQSSQKSYLSKASMTLGPHEYWASTDRKCLFRLDHTPPDKLDTPLSDRQTMKTTELCGFFFVFKAKHPRGIPEGEGEGALLDAVGAVQHPESP